jgi:uncharacterized protein (TIGR04222 family)
MLSNPFALPGPQFLLFFIVLLAVTALALAIARRLSESGPIPTDLDFDPYQIAYLRRGRPEAIHVAALSLIDRGLIVADGDLLRAADADAVHKVRRPLERAILERLQAPTRGADLYDATEVQRAADRLGDSLKRLGLLPTELAFVRRIAIFLVALLVVETVSGARVVRWIARGQQHPIEFLVVLSLLAPFVLAVGTFPRRTALGSATLRRLTQMFSGLKSRGAILSPGGTTNEIALVAAIFGFSALPPAELAQVRATGPRGPTSGGSSCGGSSCGSSSSGGSSCGGSSCGGGGGCGGCG